MIVANICKLDRTLQRAMDVPVISRIFQTSEFIAKAKSKWPPFSFNRFGMVQELRSIHDFKLAHVFEHQIVMRFVRPAVA